MSWFNGFNKETPSPSISVEYRLVEVEKPHSSLPMTKDVAAAVASLQGHPGFAWLLQKKRLQKALLQATLEKTRHKNLTDAEFLQSGIAWLSWDEAQLEKAIGWREAPEQVSKTPAETELEAFEEVSRFIEVLK